MELILMMILFVLLIFMLSMYAISYLNNKALNTILEGLINKFAKKHRFEQKSTGNFEMLKGRGPMKFQTARFEISGFGHMAVMRSSFLFTQSVSINIIPLKKDLPLLNIDIIYYMMNRMASFEVYDLVNEHGTKFQSYINRYKKLDEELAEINMMLLPVKKGWHEEYLKAAVHRRGSLRFDRNLSGVFLKGIDIYLAQMDDYSMLSPESCKEKKNMIDSFASRFSKSGGIVVNLVKDGLGEEGYRRFFEEVYFRTKDIGEN